MTELAIETLDCVSLCYHGAMMDTFHDVKWSVSLDADSHMLRYREVKFATFCMESELLSTIVHTLFLFYKNMLYENIEAEICEI